MDDNKGNCVTSDYAGFVDRRQDTVESELVNKVDGLSVVDRHNETFTEYSEELDDTVETNAGEIVNREKETVEKATTAGIVNDVTKQHGGSYARYVQRNEKDDAIVDKEKDTVENSSAKKVDKQKETVDNAATARGQRDENVQYRYVQRNEKDDSIVDREKDTVENSSVGQVDKQKETVDIGQQPGHDAQNEKGDGIVDQQEQTFENSCGAPINKQKEIVHNSGGASHGLPDYVARPSNKLHQQEILDNSGGASNALPQQPCVHEDVTQQDDLTDEFQKHHRVNRTNITPQASPVRPTGTIVELEITEVAHRGVLEGLKLNKLVTFKWNNMVVLGRGVDANIFLNDKNISRNHLGLTGQILPNGQMHFTAQNLSKTKPIFINSTEVAPKSHEIVQVKSGDIVEVVSITFALKFIPGNNSGGFSLRFIQPPAKSHHGGNSWYNAPTFHGSREGTFMLVTHAVPVQGIAPPNMVQVQGGMAPAYPYMGNPTSGYPVAPVVNSQMHHPQSPGLYPSNGSNPIASDAYALLAKYHNDEQFVTQTDLHQIAQQVVRQWKDLARVLGIPEHFIDAISMNYSTNHQEMSYQMLLTWVHRNPQCFTYKVLGRALCNQTVGRNDIAKLFCNYSKEDNET